MIPVIIIYMHQKKFLLLRWYIKWSYLTNKKIGTAYKGKVEELTWIDVHQENSPELVAIFLWSMFSTLDRWPATTFSKPLLSFICKLNSCNNKTYWMSLDLAFILSKSYFSAAWSMIIVALDPIRKDLKFSRAYTIINNSFLLVVLFFWALEPVLLA